MAQQNSGLYVLHTPASGTCPSLDWHILLQPNGSLSGFAAWDQMKHMARLNGTIAKNGAFKMNGQEVGGEDRTAVVTGTASGYYIKISINGSGTGCDNKIFSVPRFASGLAGGGG